MDIKLEILTLFSLLSYLISIQKRAKRVECAPSMANRVFFLVRFQYFYFPETDYAFKPVTVITGFFPLDQFCVAINIPRSRDCGVCCSVRNGLCVGLIPFEYKNFSWFKSAAERWGIKPTCE